MSSTPFGIFAPRSTNFFGVFKNSTISASSSLASALPATSAKVILLLLPFDSRALDCPKDIALLFAPCIWRMKNQRATERPITKRIVGKIERRKVIMADGSFTAIDRAEILSSGTPRLAKSSVTETPSSFLAVKAGLSPS